MRRGFFVCHDRRSYRRSGMDNQNRGRSGEARDPNRPVDETGEKEGLGPRAGDAPTEPTTPPEPADDTAVDEGEPSA